ncbi:hypothetical protein, variant, partial [Cladophialophora immunda]
MIRPAASKGTGLSPLWVWSLVQDLFPLVSHDQDNSCNTVVYLDDAASTGSQAAAAVRDLSHILDDRNTSRDKPLRMIMGFGAISDEARRLIQAQAAEEGPRLRLTLVNAPIEITTVDQKISLRKASSAKFPTDATLNAWMEARAECAERSWNYTATRNALRHEQNRFPDAREYYATIFAHRFPDQTSVIMRDLLAYGLDHDKQDGLIERPDWKPYANIEKEITKFSPRPYWSLTTKGWQQYLRSLTPGFGQVVVSNKLEGMNQVRLCMAYNAATNYSLECCKNCTRVRYYSTCCNCVVGLANLKGFAAYRVRRNAYQVLCIASARAEAHTKAVGYAIGLLRRFRKGQSGGRNPLGREQIIRPMTNTTLDVRVRLEVAVAQRVGAAIEIAHVVLHHREDVVVEKCGRSRRGEITIGRMKGQWVEREITGSSILTGNKIAIGEETSRRCTVVGRGGAVQAVEIYGDGVGKS